MTPRRETFAAVTIGHIRSHGCRELLVYCESGWCHHSAVLDADRLRMKRRCARCARAWSAPSAAWSVPMCGPNWSPLTGPRRSK
jgi:hypothetical protein